MDLQKACLRHGLLVETAWSPVSQTDPPLFARYIARSRRWGRERHVVFPSSKSILEGKCVSYSYDEVLG